MSYSDYYGVLTYKDPLILYKVENFDWWQHRDWAVRRDPFIKKYINQLNRLMFQETPIFIPDILESDTSIESPDESENPDSIDKPEEIRLEPWTGENILLDWNKERWDDFLVKLYDAARTHKWCIPVLYEEPPYWFVFTEREIIEIVYDDNDIPIKAHAMWTKRLPLASTINYHDIWINLVEENTEKLNKDGENTGMGLFVNWGHDLDRNIDSNDLESVWSLSIALRYILYDILCNSARSSGFFFVQLGTADDKSEIERKLQEAFEMAGNSKMFCADEQTVKEITAMYATNPEFSVEAMDKIMKIFAGATNLPYLFYNGEKDISGVFVETASEMIQINNKKREVFSQLKDYVLKLVEMRWGVICEDVYLNIPEVNMEEEDIIEGRTPEDRGVEKELKKMRIRK
jgi:hypothetical protein